MKGLVASFAVVMLAAASVQAGEVSVKGAHICCGACVRDVGKALDGVSGVSGVKADRSSKSITFTASDDKAAEAGINALAKGGFFGAAKHGDKSLKFPESGAKKGETADSVTVTGVHLCCGGCVNGAKKAVASLGNVTVDKGAKSVTVKGSKIDKLKVVTALNKAGFFASAKSKKK